MAAFLFASLFVCKDPLSLHKPSKRRNHLKPENLETTFLLAALKMPIKFVISNQVEMKYSQVSFDFYILQLYIHISAFKCALFLMLEIKSFVSLKNECCFFGRGYISREGSQILQHFETWLLIKRGPGRFKVFLVGRELGKKG